MNANGIFKILSYLFVFKDLYFVDKNVIIIL